MRPAEYSLHDRDQHALGYVTDDDRTSFEHDVDRILYSTQWRALAGKSQVVGSAELGIYHTRLTHSVKVAQLGRRMAERMLREYGGPSPALVEAACLAHDIGHPPFGHTGERALRDVMDAIRADSGIMDSFEGNAQNLRVLTYLAAHKTAARRGLHLTRACLDASMKYPWERGPADDPVRHAKWGVYAADRPAFDWVRDGRTGDVRPVEEQVMDWADDITYVCHDTEDFHRSGLIPLEALFPPKGTAGGETEREMTRFLDYVAVKRARLGRDFDREAARTMLVEFGAWWSVPAPFEGRHADAVAVNTRTARLIDHLTSGIRLDVDDAPIRYGARLHVPTGHRRLCDLLKELLWCYVIDRPALATQRHGQERIVSDLLRWAYGAVDLLPPDRQEELDEHGDALRAAADHVASLTEAQAMALHHRLSGVGLGSVNDNVWI